MSDGSNFEFKKDAQREIVFVTATGLLNKERAIDLIYKVNNVEAYPANWGLVIDLKNVLEIDIPVRELFEATRIMIQEDNRSGDTVVVVGDNDGRFTYGKLLEYALNGENITKLTIANSMEEALSHFEKPVVVS